MKQSNNSKKLFYRFLVCWERWWTLCERRFWVKLTHVHHLQDKKVFQTFVYNSSFENIFAFLFWKRRTSTAFFPVDNFEIISDEFAVHNQLW